MSDKRKWVPEIMYEGDDDGVTQNLPFVQVPEDKEMPGILFMFSSRETGEFEPDQDGNELPITELDLHQYGNLAYIKEVVPAGVYDAIRVALGLEPVNTAAEKGRKITDNIRNNLL